MTNPVSGGRFEAAVREGQGDPSEPDDPDSPDGFCDFIGIRTGGDAVWVPAGGAPDPELKPLKSR